MIQVVKVKNREEGNRKAHDILKKLVDNKTLLALSGGTSPDYQKMIVEPTDILPGAVCIVDERCGPDYYEDSNYYLLKTSGVLYFLRKNKIPFSPDAYERNPSAMACDYEEEIDELFKKYHKKVGVMGVGSNLHTAGIFPNSSATSNVDLVVMDEVDDKFPDRVTLTLKALGEFTNFVILAFGKEKKEALKKVLDEKENNMQKYPAIFYRKSKMKSYLITDQNVNI